MGSSASISAALRACPQRDLTDSFGLVPAAHKDRIMAAMTKQSDVKLEESDDQHPAMRALDAPMTEAGLLDGCSLNELLTNGNIALVIKSHYNKREQGWLHTSYIDEGIKLVRRQELPEDALLKPDEAQRQEGFYNTGVISHGWLAPDHPDPHSMRREDVKAIPSKFLVWDFLSFFQMPRDSKEELCFRVALSSMHLVFGHPHWIVYRLMSVPEGVEKSTNYLNRAWCMFECAVAVVRANGLVSIQNGQKCNSVKSPVPSSSAKFAESIKECEFPEGHMNAKLMSQLYDRATPFLAKHERTCFYAWDDQDVEQFLNVLGEFPGMKTVRLINDEDGCTARLAEEIEAKFRAALEARGGELTYCKPAA